jgi:hypothetical protein
MFDYTGRSSLSLSLAIPKRAGPRTLLYLRKQGTEGRRRHHHGARAGCPYPLEGSGRVGGHMFV